MKMNKKFAMMMMSLVVVGSLFVGCGKTTAPKTEDNTVVEETQEQVTEEVESTEEVTEEAYGDVDPTPSLELFYVVTDGLDLPTSMEMTTEFFADAYGIDPSLLDSYYVSMPMMNVHADEIAIFELKEGTDAAVVKAGIEKRQQALLTQWQSYLPEQLELVENYKVVEKDNKIMFVIGNQQDEMIERFNAAE